MLCLTGRGRGWASHPSAVLESSKVSSRHGEGSLLLLLCMFWTLVLELSSGSRAGSHVAFAEEQTAVFREPTRQCGRPGPGSGGWVLGASALRGQRAARGEVQAAGTQASSCALLAAASHAPGPSWGHGGRRWWCKAQPRGGHAVGHRENLSTSGNSQRKTTLRKSARGPRGQWPFSILVKIPSAH